MVKKSLKSRREGKKKGRREEWLIVLGENTNLSDKFDPRGQRKWHIFKS